MGMRDSLVNHTNLPGAPAHPHAFPRRNRVIAALSRAVVVVDAAARSGALITEDHALDLGREVFAVPGGLHSRQSQGTNALIRDGARILLGPDQLLEELEWARPDPAPEVTVPAGLSPEAGRVWRSLDTAPAHVDELVRRSGVGLGTVLAVLTDLEAEGWAVQRAGARYTLSDRVPGSVLS